MPFDIQRWRAELRLRLEAIARDPRDAQALAGAPGLAGLCLGAAVLPLGAALAEDAAAAFGALNEATRDAPGGGGALLADLAQGRYSTPDALGLAARGRRRHAGPGLSPTRPAPGPVRGRRRGAGPRRPARGPDPVPDRVRVPGAALVSG